MLNSKTKELNPIDYARNLVFSHPGLLDLDSSKTYVLEDINEQENSLNVLATSISSQGPAGKDRGWAKIIKIGEIDKKGVNEYQPSEKTLKAAVAVLQDSLSAVQSDPRLKNILWMEQQGKIGGYRPVIPPISPFQWTINNISPRFGLAIDTISADPATGKYRLEVKNLYPIFLTVYAEFLAADGSVITPGQWQSRLPASVRNTFETGSKKYLGLVRPTNRCEGIPIDIDKVEIEFTQPANAAAVRLIFGGIGGSNWDNVVNPVAVMVSGVLGYAVPGLLNAGSVVSPTAWYNQLPGKREVLEEVITAASVLADASNSTEALSILKDNIGPLFFNGQLSHLLNALKKEMKDNLIESAEQINWGIATLHATAAAATSPGNQFNEILSTPSTFSLEINPDMVKTLAVNVLPDPGHGVWPLDADHFDLTIDYNGNTQKSSGQINGIFSPDPLAVSFKNIPSNCTVKADVALYDRNDRQIAKGSASASAGSPIILLIAETAAAVNENTVYTALLDLDYSERAGYHWKASVKNKATIKNLDCGNTGRNLCQLVALTLNTDACMAGYCWRASGQDIPACTNGGGITEAQLYTFRNISKSADPGKAFKSTGCGFYMQPFIVYSKKGKTDNFYLDPRNSPYHLRQIVLDETTPFDLSLGESWGTFTIPHVSDILIHPEGYAAAVSWSDNIVQIVKLTAKAVPDTQAPLPYTIGGKGTRVGLLNGPLALALSPGNDFIVLETINHRLQAFDLYGNPIPYFPGNTACLPLKNNRQYLDLALDCEGYIYILSYKNDGSKPEDYQLDLYSPGGEWLSSTPTMNAAKIAVDSWRNIYTLNYETITGKGGGIEPSITIWIPGRQ